MILVFIYSLIYNIQYSVLDIQGQHVEREALSKRTHFVIPNMKLKQGLIVHNDNCCYNSQYVREWKNKEHNRKEGHMFIASQCFMKVWH